MTSGYGIRGKTPRCYPLYKDFAKCMYYSDNEYACFDLREDYFECLHGNRVNAIAQEIQEELDRQQVKKDTEIKERSARVRRVQLT